MMDVLSTHLQNLYNPWPLTQDLSRPPPFVLKQVAQKRKIRELQNSKVSRYEEHREKLHAVKDNPWKIQSLRERALVPGASCLSCTSSKYRLPKKEYAIGEDIEDLLRIDEENSPNIFVRWFSLIIRTFRLKRFLYTTICDSVLNDETVKNAITETTTDLLSETADDEQNEALYHKIYKEQLAKARFIIRDMHAALSHLMLQITSYVLFKLIPKFVSSISIHPGQVEMLRKAAESNLPMVIVPLHRSHLDYILIILTMLNRSIRSPITAAGNNLKIPVFGILLRWLGAFFIKRRIEATSGSKDILYRTVLHAYMVQCLKVNHNVKFYIEGGRTRTGKACLPKVGLLSVIVDAYMDGAIEDALLVPASVNYDKLVDGNFVRELLGQPKKKETFTAAISAIWSVINSRYGAVRVGFNEPMSLKDLVKSFKMLSEGSTLEPPINTSLAMSSSMNSLHGTDVAREDHRDLVKFIANHIVYDAVVTNPIMSTNVLAFLLLVRFRNGIQMSTLVQYFDHLTDRLRFNGKVVSYQGCTIDVINEAIKVLGPSLIKRERPQGSSEMDEVITPITTLPNVIELSYYGNALLPYFALHSVIATAAGVTLRNVPDSSLEYVSFRKGALMEHSLALCDLLQFEFIFNKPCQSVETVIESALNDLIANEGVFSIINDNNIRCSEDEDEDSENVSEVFYKLNATSLEHFQTLAKILSPLIDTYMATILALRRLVSQVVSENVFTQEVLEDLRSYLDTKYCSNGESSSVDPIKNACKVLRKWGVLESHMKDSVRLIYLHDDFNSLETVNALIKKVEVFKWTQ